MAEIAIDPKQRAHELIERMSAAQVSAVARLLEAMLDPVSIALANAPTDDEPVSDEEIRDIAESRAAYARGDVVAHDEVLAEFGLTAHDFERMGQAPVEVSLEAESRHPGQ